MRTQEVASATLKEIHRIFDDLRTRRDIWEIFNDWLAMFAIAISNSVDFAHRDYREKAYMDIVKKYSQKDLEKLSTLCSKLVEIMEYHATKGRLLDVLGDIFHELAIHNKLKGQFFTPQEIADMMGKIVGFENDLISQKGYVAVAEPSAGSGACVLGYANAMRERGFSYSTQLVVQAKDIDPKCVHMAYIQLSLYGIPAVIIQGDTLADTEIARWYTPIYILDGWSMRLRMDRLRGLIGNQEPKLQNKTPQEVATPVFSTNEKTGQLSLF